MPNMIQELGADFFTEKFSKALFIRDNVTYRVLGAVENKKIRCTNIANGAAVDIPHEFFTGFRVFAYPRLGWRRFGDNVLAYAIKTQSAKRGLAAERVTLQYSPATAAYMIAGLAVDRVKNKEQNIMVPTWDTAADVRDVLKGNKSGAVLSEDIIVEPSTRGVDSYFVALHGLNVAAHFSDKGVPKWSSEKYKQLCEPVIYR